MAFIFFLLIFALLVILLIPTILFSVVRTLFSILGFSLGGRRKGRSKASESAYKDDYDASASYRRRNSSAADGQRKKMFDKDEGEYVDFEEIKDEK